MCCCEKPNINGQPGYRWQPNDTPSVYQPLPPTMQEGDQLLYDEPGRCGGIDSHTYHFRVAKRSVCLYLLVRHGGGEERIDLRFYGNGFREAVQTMDTNTRYWLLHEIYHAHADAARKAREAEATRWQTAAAEKRIRTRRYPKRGTVKVWIETPDPIIAQNDE